VVGESIAGPDEPEMSLVLWNVSTGEAVARVQPPGGAMQLQFSADGVSAVIVGKRSMWLFTQVDRLTR
jgi:hypothetical protein